MWKGRSLDFVAWVPAITHSTHPQAVTRHLSNSLSAMRISSYATQTTTSIKSIATCRVLASIDTVRTHTSNRDSSHPPPPPPPTLCHGTFANAHLRPAKPHCTKRSTRPRMPTQTPQHSKIHSSASSKTSAFRFFIIAPPLTAIPLQAETLLTTPFHSFSLFPALAGS